jgi:hypothetical protein
VGPRAGLDSMEKREIVHCLEPKSGRPARSSLYMDCAILAPHVLTGNILNVAVDIPVLL